MNVAREILIVEDSATQAERLCSLLEENGYAVRVAADGGAALEAVRDRLPELVVTDVVMPGMDGYELCETIKSDDELSDVPVILLTSLAEPEDIVRSLACGADNFIRKPYDDGYLLSRISNMLVGRELRRSGKLKVGLEVYLSGEKHFIDAERQQILDFLLSTYEDVAQINHELAAKNRELEVRQREVEAALSDLSDAREDAQKMASVNRAVLDATVDGIALVDGDGKKLLWNQAYERAATDLGLRPEASIAEDVEAIAGFTADPAGCRAFADSLAANRELKARYDLELPDARRSLQILSGPVRGLSSDLIGRIFVFRDVTTEREAGRLKSELVATVSHELRTPLTAVVGFAELLGNSELDDSTQKRYLRVISSEAARLTALVNDFLDLHRIEHGAFDVTLEPVDVAELLREQVGVFSAQSTLHSLGADLPETPLIVLGERNRLAQVFANLLSNAIKYSPRGGPIDVRARQVGESVEVSVRDSGLGIPEQQRDMIFTKFFRVDSSDARRIGGTGLGLALCREIVEAHGGEIDFDTVEGEGSTFSIRLPAAVAALSAST
jgi:signal transduction histidine kinase/ActR/RegA family two-component response regulator